jgi:hypothetical protein
MTLPVRYRDRLAMAAAIVGLFAAASVVTPFRGSFPNTDAALVMVVLVVAVAANGDRLAGYLAAGSCALAFDFFLTQPYERLTITHDTDIEATLLLLAIGIAVTELAVWGRRQHAAAERRAEHLGRIFEARRLTPGPGHTATDEVCAQLVRVLQLQACRFQPGVAGLGAAARLNPDGSVTMGAELWHGETQGLPRTGEVELLVVRWRTSAGALHDDQPKGFAAIAGEQTCRRGARRPGRRSAGAERTPAALDTTQTR